MYIYIYVYYHEKNVLFPRLSQNGFASASTHALGHMTQDLCCRSITTT